MTQLLGMGVREFESRSLHLKCLRPTLVFQIRNNKNCPLQKYDISYITPTTQTNKQTCPLQSLCHAYYKSYSDWKVGFSWPGPVHYGQPREQFGLMQLNSTEFLVAGQLSVISEAGLKLIYVDGICGWSMRPRVWGLWVRIPKLALEAGDQNFVRKGGFLVVERVLRPYHWPQALLSLFMHSGEGTMFQVKWVHTLVSNSSQLFSFFFEKNGRTNAVFSAIF